MAYEQFIERDFKPESLALIRHVETVLDDYQAQGFTMTLRQVYYQLVQANIISNEERAYKNLGNLLSSARLAGLLDWDAMEDRGRNVNTHSTWETAPDFSENAVHWYARNMWKYQPYRPFVYEEKDALIGVVEPACNRFQVPYFATRGYCSQSELYAQAKIMEQMKEDGLYPVVFYLGDHDPSGIDMTRDIEARLETMAYENIEVVRLALNRDQVDRLRLPANPAKTTDIRFGKKDPITGLWPPNSYMAVHGEESWELDALKPKFIDDLLTVAFKAIIEPDGWQRAKEEQEFERERVRRIANNFERCEALLDEHGEA